ncbi:MAG: hypothetical protein VX460_06905 [Planctomycetota bacterium]|nr:hypothetical protein [Planctomycetota bacterium]
MMLAAALLTLPRPDALADTVRLVHTPREGAVIAVALDQTSTTEVASVQEWPTIDGERQEDEVWTAEDVGGHEFELSIQFEDTFETVGQDGRVGALVRRFEEIAGTSLEMATGDGRSEDQEERELVSPLEGRAVRFTWDEEEGDHSCAFLREGGDEALDAVLLGDQRIDAFGGWFLPPLERAEVAPGDRWELTRERWNDFLRMGGEFWVDAADAGAPDEEHAAHVRDFEGQLLRNGESDLACWLAAVAAEDGERVAVIGFEGTLDSHAKQDYTSAFDGTRGEVSARVEHEMRVEGSCRFDLDAGRALSIETRIAITTTTTERTIQEGPGPRVQGTDFVTVEDTVTEVAVTFEERGG